MRTINQSLIAIGLAFACATVARADFQPVPLTPSSFTYDVVVEKTAPPPLQNFATAWMDSGTNCTGNTWFEAGFVPGHPYMGVPPHGTTFISHNETNHVWLMPPSYTTNNVAYVGANNIPGSSPGILQTQVLSATLNVLTPVPNTLAISILWGFSGTPVGVNVTINQNDGGVQSALITPIDWFNGSGAYEYLASGRCQADGGAGTINTVGSSTQTKMFRTDINVNDTIGAVTNLVFSYANGANPGRFMAFAVSATTDGTHYNPLVVNGFNYDGIVESNASFKADCVQGITVSMDGGPIGAGNTYFEEGFSLVNYGTSPFNNGTGPINNGGGNITTNWSTSGTTLLITNATGAPYGGMPHPGTTVSGLATPNHVFQMPPTYATNHCIFTGNYTAQNTTNVGLYSSPTWYNTIPNFTNGSFTILQPVSGYNMFSILAGAGNGPVTNSYVISYAEGSQDTGLARVDDWWSGGSILGSGVFSNNLVWNSACLVAAFGQPGINNKGGGYTSYHGTMTYWDIPVNPALTPTNISFTWANPNNGVSGGNGRCAIFALSGSSNAPATFSSSGTWAPIAVSGWNQTCIVPKEQPLWPAGLFPYTTATMDNGTNNYANTLTERGWCTNGVGANGGMPPAGTILNSVSDPSKHYQLPASWSANNSIMVDTNHATALLTPATPLIFSAFSVLTAGGNQTGNLLSTNLAVFFHADGSAETNIFYGLDWFNNNANANLPGGGTTINLAFVVNGRTDNRGATEQNIAGGTNGVGGVTKDPRLFETFFPLNNLTSPVTNIFFVYIRAPVGHDVATTQVLALSATKDSFVAPAVAITPATNQDNQFTCYEGTSVPIFAGTAGIPPTTVQWQYSADGVNWANLSNGGTFSGVTTTNMTISSVGWTNSGQYRMYGCNFNGCVTNFPATVQVYSTLPDVTQPADPIQPYQPNGGCSPGSQQVSLAISDRVGVDTGGTPKYLNFGGNGSCANPPFVGPVGLIVSPKLGKTTLSAFRVYTADGNVERDPANYLLEGSNDGVSWTTISSGGLSLTVSRNANTPSAVPNPLVQAVQEVHFTNPNGYVSYRLSFPNSVNDPAANSVQVAEIELLGVVSPGCPTLLQDVVADVRVVAGASPNFLVRASASPAPAYQWQRNNGGGYNNIGGATSASYTLANAQISDSGALFHCIIDNGCGTPVTSGPAHLTVIAAPTAAYPTNVLHDTPVAFFRLDEGPDDGTGGGNNGITTYDLWGGHNGYYSNSIISPNSPNSFPDPSDSTAYFGKSGGNFIPIGGTPDSAVEAIPGIDFSKPAGQNGEFSVEAWVMGDPTLIAGGVVGGAGIISKGYGNGGEQFCLDAGGPAANGFAHTFRFFVRDGGSETPAIASSGGIGPDPGVWHHLVGVCDQANGAVQLYIDGVPQGQKPGNISPGAGILGSPAPVLIGGRSASSITNNNLIFYGTIDEAAIYNYPLSLSQILNHYYSITNLAPMIQAGNDLPASVALLAGRPLNLQARFVGTPPLTYQWYKNGSPVAGATANTFFVPNTTTNDAGTYNVTACNNYPAPNTCTSSGNCAVTIETVVDFNVAGAGWQFQINDTTPLGGRGFDSTTPDAVLKLTDSQASEATSAFYGIPLYIGAFQANFIFQATAFGGGAGEADGITFCLQNDPRGPAAVGGGGGALAVSGITPSFEVAINIYAGATGGRGWGLGVNGANGVPYNSIAPIDLTSGDPMNVTLTYLNQKLTFTVVDTVSSATFSTSVLNTNLPAAVGTNVAYVGFTGATGGGNATQTISNFNYVAIPTMTATHNPNGTVTISWPLAIGGYSLLETTSFQPISWSVSGATVAPVGNFWQATVTPTGQSKFYKLALSTTSPP